MRFRRRVLNEHLPWTWEEKEEEGEAGEMGRNAIINPAWKRKSSMKMLTRIAVGWRAVLVPYLDGIIFAAPLASR